MDQVARETLEGQVIYPERLPKTRGSIADISAVIFLVVLLLAAVMLKMGYGDSSYDVLTFTDSVIHVVNYAALWICVSFVGEIFIRIFLVNEERHHLMGRYDGKWDHLLKDAFNFCSATWFFVVVSFSCVSMYYMKTGSLPYDCHQVVNCLLLVFSYILSKILRLDKSQLMHNIQMERIQPLDYGSGMALNFFYGYLRLVLPATGDGEKGIKERIRDYIDKQGLDDHMFPVKKLFILIPSSTYLPPKLEDVSYDDWMEPAQSLEKQVKDRAGVIARVYKNSVYKIQDPQRDDMPPTYVVAEGATPLKTLDEAIQYSGEKKEFLMKHKKQIILSFYETLRKELKENKDCHDLCELVYYVDIDEFGRRRVNAAKKILDRIREIKEKEAVLRNLGDG